MNQDDVRALVRGVAPVVQELVIEAQRPLLDRIAVLERQLAQPPVAVLSPATVQRMIAEAQVTASTDARQLVAGLERRLTEVARSAAERAIAVLPPPKDGKDADPELVRQLVADAVAALPPAQPGKDADPELVRQLVADAVAALPPAQPGKDADPAEIERRVRNVIAELAPTLKGEPGKDVTMAEVQEWISAELATWPKPQDGKSVDPAEVSVMVKAAVEALPPPKDGAGVASALIDRGGQLVLTLTNGEVRELGQVVGRDADPEEVRRQVTEAVEAIPRPRDGTDGFSLEDLEVEQKAEGRILELRFQRGDLRKTFELTFPVVIDRGVWREGGYAKGDAVTWGGGVWIAQKDTEAKPAEGDDWRLAVRRGRDGKDLAPPAPKSTTPVQVGVPTKKTAGEP